LLDLIALEVAATLGGARVFPSALLSGSASAAAAAAAAFGASLRFRLARRLGVSGEFFIVTKADAIVWAESMLSFKSTQDVTCSCISSQDVWVVRKIYWQQGHSYRLSMEIFRRSCSGNEGGL